MTTKYESTIRMEPELADRLDVIAQVLDESKNQLIVNAITKMVENYEGNSGYKSKQQEWLERLQRTVVA